MHSRPHVQSPVGRTLRPFFLLVALSIGSFLGIFANGVLAPVSQAHAAVNASSGIMNTTVYDITHNRTYNYGTTGQFIVASSMKVPIMLTFFDMIQQQGRGPSNYELSLLTTMIENSNNNSASALYYNIIGGAPAVTRYMQKIGVTGLWANPGSTLR